MFLIAPLPHVRAHLGHHRRGNRGADTVHGDQITPGQPEAGRPRMPVGGMRTMRGGAADAGA
jgi:hypothetical protein